MNKVLFPVAAVAVLLLTTSCGEDQSGTSFEVINANHDEVVNPANIRGYGGVAPGMPGPAIAPSQYYPLNTKTVPEATRQLLDGKVAVQMVTNYYSQSRSLEDLAEEHYPATKQGNTLNSPSDTGGNNNSGNANTNSGGAGSQTKGSDGATQSGNKSGSGNTTDQN